jgi:hypothetical protein
MTEDDEGFLKRWSRLKHQSDRESVDGADALPEAPPELPELGTLGPDSDFSAFMHPKVEPALRRAALAKLFRSPQYQAMDGLDVYIDDYSNPAPLAPAVAAGLKHARSLLARENDVPAATRAAENTETKATPASNSSGDPALTNPASGHAARVQTVSGQSAADSGNGALPADQRFVEDDERADRDDGEQT